jgi:hypothetical protein
MAKRAKKAVSKRGGNPGSTPNVLESLTGDDALAILKVLGARDRRLALEIEAIAKERFSSVEMDAIAADVMMGLESLVVEDVWDRSGSKRDGYVDPGEAAWEMFEETLQPIRDEVGKYHRLSMLQEADLVCQGILKRSCPSWRAPRHIRATLRRRTREGGEAASQKKPVELEEVIVTGSHIRGESNLTVPLTTITRVAAAISISVFEAGLSMLLRLRHLLSSRASE